MDEIIENFWEEYIKADEIEQSKMLDTLTAFKNKDNNSFLKFITKTMIKSYLDDIIKYFQEKANK